LAVTCELWDRGRLVATIPPHREDRANDARHHQPADMRP
jgi:hypothetical protein